MIKNVVEILAAIIFGGFCVYILARLAGAGWYKSKKEHLLHLMSTTRKPVMSERRRTERREEYIP
jgi:hypothetical protein